MPAETADPPAWQPTDYEGIDRLRRELHLKDRELQELRSQLRAIHTSDAWAMIRTLCQIRYALAPHGTRRDEMLKRGMRGLRRLKKGISGLAGSARGVSRRIASDKARRIRIEPAMRGKYAVVCLPVIEWGFRFQRPQQLMRQFAEEGHLVLYASHRFHRGGSARMRAVDTNILEVALPGDPAANIFQMLPTESDCRRMTEALARLRAELGLAGAVVVAQHPYWTALSESLRERFGWPIVYDCMDDHSGFLHNGEEILETETRLIETSDLVVASSAVLLEGLRRRARTTLLLRNACEYEHFCTVGDKPPRRRETPRIGYYGAIADWFDSRLVGELAGLRPDWQFELIGSTLAGDVRPLRDAANIRLLGERDYDELPRLIGEWDLFIIPFKRVALTEATNPVKVYEMLATGKPVVAVGLPELVPIAREGLIRLARTAGDFAAAIEQQLEGGDAPSASRRRAFARQNTWRIRRADLAAAIDRLPRRCTPGLAHAGGSPSAASTRA
jgi:hypothetical protein